MMIMMMKRMMNVALDAKQWGQNECGDYKDEDDDDDECDSRCQVLVTE